MLGTTALGQHKNHQIENQQTNQTTPNDNQPAGASTNLWSAGCAYPRVRLPTGASANGHDHAAQGPEKVQNPGAAVTKLACSIIENTRTYLIRVTFFAGRRFTHR